MIEYILYSQEEIDLHTCGSLILKCPIKEERRWTDTNTTQMHVVTHLCKSHSQGCYDIQRWCAQHKNDFNQSLACSIPVTMIPVTPSTPKLDTSTGSLFNEED